MTVARCCDRMACLAAEKEPIIRYDSDRNKWTLYTPSKHVYLTNLSFCPFCGAALPLPVEKKAMAKLYFPKKWVTVVTEDLIGGLAMVTGDDINAPTIFVCYAKINDNSWAWQIARVKCGLQELLEDLDTTLPATDPQRAVDMVNVYEPGSADWVSDVAEDVPANDLVAKGHIVGTEEEVKRLLELKARELFA